MSKYAQNTSVPVANSRTEVMKILKSAGATKMGFMDEGGSATVGFELNGIAVKLQVSVPEVNDILMEAEAADKKPWGWWSKNPNQRRVWAEDKQEDELRRKWRVMVLLLKAKLEAISDGYSTVEREFLYDVMIRGGKTVGEMLKKDIEKIISGERPTLMLGSGN